MREILFRGKTLDRLEWKYGDFARVQNPFSEDGDPVTHMICDGTSAFNWRVDPDSIGQYIGLKDENGRKIFEGDIIAYFNCCGNVVTGTVRYGYPTWLKNGRSIFDPEFYVDWDNGNSHGLMAHSMSWWAPRIAVIGNEYDKKMEAKNHA